MTTVYKFLRQRPDGLASAVYTQYVWLPNTWHHANGPHGLHALTHVSYYLIHTFVSGILHPDLRLYHAHALNPVPPTSPITHPHAVAFRSLRPTNPVTANLD